MKYPTPHLAILKARDDSLQDGRIVKQASISNLLIAPEQPTIPFLGSTQLFIRRTVKPLVPKAHRDRTNSTCNRTHHTYPSRNNFTRASEFLPRYPNSVSKVPPWTSASKEAYLAITSRMRPLIPTTTSTTLVASNTNISNACTTVTRATWAPRACHQWREGVLWWLLVGYKEGENEQTFVIRALDQGDRTTWRGDILWFL